jgi:hypothetical protein
MPRSTPKKAGRKAPKGARFLEDVLARNIRGYRTVQDLDQAELGRRMAALGLGWDAGVVGFVERGDRNVTLSELLGLMLVLGKTFGELMNPKGVDGSIRDKVDVGFPSGPLGPEMVRDWLGGDVRFTIVDYSPEMKVRTSLLRPEDQIRAVEKLVERGT